MAEAVALGASVVAFIQLADRVITMSKNLIDSGADMPTTLRMAHTEALSLRDILKELKQRQSMSSIPEVEASTVLLNATKKPADKCHASMEQLEVELSRLSISPSHSQISPSKRQRIKQTVKWAAGGEERVKKLLTTLMTEKLTLSLALVAEMSEDMKDVKSKTVKVEKHLTDAQRHDVLRWLEHTNPSDIHNRSRRLYEKLTGEWMLRSTAWKSFIHGGHRFLWVHGIPGAGKTILISHLADKLRGLQNWRTGWALYYCYFGRSQDEAEPFLRWIIVQLCQQASFVPPELHQIYEQRHQPGINVALSILATLLEKFGTAYVAIDGVDESKPYTGLLAVLTTLMTDSRFAKLRLLISSREYLDIEEALKPHTVAVSMSNEVVEGDIRIFVGAALRSNPKFQSWPPLLYREVEVALAKGARGMFRWAVCQIDILGRLKSQSAVRKALLELPESLDETYERILQTIPTEHREFTRATLSILAGQSELGEAETQMTPGALLSMVLRNLGLEWSTDHFYNIYDIRETCGCLVTFTMVDMKSLAWDTTTRGHQEKEVVLFAHYTVKEFLYADRTAHSLNVTARLFALDQHTTAMRWARCVMEIAVSARETGRPISSDSIEDYCQGIALILLKAWQQRMVNHGLASLCLGFLDPTGAHHLRRREHRIIRMELTPVPATSHLVGALAECLSQKFWPLARAATQMLNANQILSTPLLVLTPEWDHWRNTSNPGLRAETAQVLLETSLLLSVFAPELHDATRYGRWEDEIQKNDRDPQLEILANAVGWDAVLFAATAQHYYHAQNTSGCPIKLLIGRGANVNSVPCRATPLQVAALRWDYDAAKILIDNGADVNMVGSAEGNKLAGLNLHDNLIYESPLSIVRKTQSLFRENPSIRVRRVATGGAAKLKLEQLLLGTGAKDFTITPEISEL